LYEVKDSLVVLTVEGEWGYTGRSVTCIATPDLDAQTQS